MPSRAICASACSSCSPQSQRSEWKTSPVRHSEWTRTSTFSAPSTSPLTSATCVLPVSFSRNAIAVNSPYSVGRRTAAPRSTSFSWRRRYSTRSATVIIFSPCRSQYGTRSGTRAIVPSSFMISQTTPDGLSPASRARSTAASVWPMRSSTPPGFARSGKHVPGLHEVVRRRVRVDRDLDRVAAVGGGDAGRHALARLDRDRERGAERRLVVVGHRAQRRARRRAPRSGRGRSARARAWP